MSLTSNNARERGSPESVVPSEGGGVRLFSTCSCVVSGTVGSQGQQCRAEFWSLPLCPPVLQLSQGLSVKTHLFSSPFSVPHVCCLAEQPYPPGGLEGTTPPVGHMGTWPPPVRPPQPPCISDA